MQIESLRIKFIIIICEFAQSIHDLDKLIGLYSDTIGNEKILNKILNKHQKYHEILNQ